MNGRLFTLALMVFCLTSWTLVEIAEARRGGGGGGFSRGGGGFTRGGGGGNFGSIRNSGRPASGAVSRPSPGQFQDRRPSQRPAPVEIPSAQRQNLKSRQEEMSPERKQRIEQWQSGGTTGTPQIRDKAANMSPEQKQQVKDAAAKRTPQQRQPLEERMANLSPEQKDQLRQKFENSGINPENLPDRDAIREDWQDWRDQNREDWQDWYEDMYHDYWDDHWHSSWWYGYPVSTVSFSFYIDDRPPCQQTVVINQAGGSTTSYYYCDSMWYQPVYTSGDVKYVVTSPPPGAELTSLLSPHRITVNGQDYYLSNHVFYQKVVRSGQTLYITVDAPLGAQVPTIPQYAVAIEKDGQTYYRFDQIFYQRSGQIFVVVRNPGV